MAKGKNHQPGGAAAVVEALVRPTVEGFGLRLWDVRFEKEGLIAETSVLGCKRYYQITPAGKAAYTAECTRLQLCLQNAAAAAQGAFAPAALPGKELDDHDQSMLQNPLAAHPLPTV